MGDDLDIDIEHDAPQHRRNTVQGEMDIEIDDGDVEFVDDGAAPAPRMPSSGAGLGRRVARPRSWTRGRSFGAVRGRRAAAAPLRMPITIKAVHGSPITLSSVDGRSGAAAATWIFRSVATSSTRRDLATLEETRPFCAHSGGVGCVALVPKAVEAKTSASSNVSQATTRTRFIFRCRSGARAGSLGTTTSATARRRRIRTCSSSNRHGVEISARPFRLILAVFECWRRPRSNAIEASPNAHTGTATRS